MRIRRSIRGLLGGGRLSALDRENATRLRAVGTGLTPTGEQGGSTKGALRFAVLYFLLPVALPSQ